MTKQEQALADVLPSDLPDYFDGHSLPGLQHCVGTDKLIGALYGTAIFEECGLRGDTVHERLTRLSSLLRAFIVIDDFAKDHGICMDRHPALALALQNVQDQCIHLISTFTDEPDALWSAYHRIYEDTYEHFDNRDLYTSIIGKCYPIFLPFELPVVLQKNRSTEVRSAMMDYLFCLQLMDDFQDMEDDLLGPKNHNLFVAGLSSDAAFRVVALRPLIVRALFEYVTWNLQSIHERLLGPTAKRSLCHSLKWVRHKIMACAALPSIPMFHGPLLEFRFNYDLLLGQAGTYVGSVVPEADDMSAESMHTTTPDNG